MHGDMKTKIILKIAIAVILLLCLADMPYGFYTIVRIASTAAFAYLAYESFREKAEGKAFFFVSLALLFQPFFKFALGRTIWNIVDVLVAIVLCYFIVIDFRKSREPYDDSK